MVCAKFILLVSNGMMIMMGAHPVLNFTPVSVFTCFEFTTIFPLLFLLSKFFYYYFVFILHRSIVTKLGFHLLLTSNHHHPHHMVTSN